MLERKVLLDTVEAFPVLREESECLCEGMLILGHSIFWAILL